MAIKKIRNTTSLAYFRRKKKSLQFPLIFYFRLSHRVCTCLSVSVTVCSSVVCGFCFCVYACMCLSSPSSSILNSPFNYLSASTSVFFCIVVVIPKLRRKSFAVYLRLLPLSKTKHRKLNQNQFVYAKKKYIKNKMHSYLLE